ncbi:hypothetical protein GW17_00036378, partial [Ensete ventricosum]
SLIRDQKKIADTHRSFITTCNPGDKQSMNPNLTYHMLADLRERGSSSNNGGGVKLQSVGGGG